jgi:hypothetical protein
VKIDEKPTTTSFWVLKLLKCPNYNIKKIKKKKKPQKNIVVLLHPKRNLAHETVSLFLLLNESNLSLHLNLPYNVTGLTALRPIRMLRALRPIRIIMLRALRQRYNCSGPVSRRERDRDHALTETVPQNFSLKLQWLSQNQSEQYL